MEFVLEQQNSESQPLVVTYQPMRNTWLAMSGMGLLAAALVVLLIQQGMSMLVALPVLVIYFLLWDLGNRFFRKDTAHRSRYYFSQPDEIVCRVRMDENSLIIETPKLYQNQFSWAWFSLFDVQGDTLRLHTFHPVVNIRLNALSPTDRRELIAMLSRVFAETHARSGPYIPHCFGCGYNLTGCDGPTCPECGRNFHRVNYPKHIRGKQP